MEILIAVLVVIALIFMVCCLEGWLLMVIFNWVMGLFSVSFALTFWQAFGVCLLLSFIGSFFRGSSSSK